jgi:hypothetical protein
VNASDDSLPHGGRIWHWYGESQYAAWQAAVHVRLGQSALRATHAVLCRQVPSKRWTQISLLLHAAHGSGGIGSVVEQATTTIRPSQRMARS